MLFSLTSRSVSQQLACDLIEGIDSPLTPQQPTESINLGASQSYTGTHPRLGPMAVFTDTSGYGIVVFSSANLPEWERLTAH